MIARARHVAGDRVERLVLAREAVGGARVDQQGGAALQLTLRQPGCDLGAS